MSLIKIFERMCGVCAKSISGLCSSVMKRSPNNLYFPDVNFKNAPTMKLKALYDFLLSYNHLLPLSKHKFLFFFEKFYNGLCRGTVILWYSTSSCDNDGPRRRRRPACRSSEQKLLHFRQKLLFAL